MATKEIKSKLKSAKGAISEKQYERALEVCEEILDLDSENYHALVFAGKCSFELGRKGESKDYYKRATLISKSDPLAWKGLADFYDKTEIFTFEDKTNAIEIYEQYLTFIGSDTDKLRQYKKKLARLYKQVDNHDKAIEVLLELTEDQESGKDVLVSSWEMLVDLLLYRLERKPSIKDMEQVGRGLCILEESSVTIERRRKFLELCRNMFYKTPLVSEAELILETVLSSLPVVLKSLPEQNAVKSVAVLGEMCVCSALTSYPLSLKASLKSTCEKLTEIDVSVCSVSLCEVLLMIDDVTKLKECLEKISAEDCPLLGSIVRGVVRLRMCSYPSAQKDLIQSLERISSLPACWESAYKIFFKMLLAECSAGLGEWSDVHEVLRDVGAQVDEVFTLEHIKPLMIRMYIGQGDLVHANELIDDLPQDQVPTMAMKAEVLLVGKDYSSAMDILQAALGVSPSFFRVHYLLGVCCWEWPEGGRRKDAYKHFVKAASLNPYYSNAYYYLGLHFELLVRDQSKAEQCYSKAVERSPTNESAAKALADILAKREDEEKLLSLYKQVTSVCSVEKAKWAWKRMGLFLKSKSEYTAALTSFFKVVKTDPRDHSCWEYIAESYFSRGSYSAALKSFNKSLEITPSCLYCMSHVASTKSILGDMVGACQDYDSVLSEDPTYLLALKGLGETHHKMAAKFLEDNFDGRAVEHTELSLKYLVRAAKQKPRFSSIWKSLGDACMCLVDVDIDSSPWKLTVPAELVDQRSTTVKKSELLEIASRVYAHVCNLDPQTSHGWHDVAVCLYHRAKVDEEDSEKEKLSLAAIEAIKKAIDLAPNDAHHWCALGVMATMMGSSHYAMSQDAYIRSLKLNENSPVVWTNLGVLYLKADSVKLAHDCFRRAQSCDPSYQPAWVCEAHVAEVIGETAEALDMYRHATELEYSDESSRRYAHLVCETVKSLPRDQVMQPDGASLHPIAMRSVLQAKTCMEKYIRRHPDDVVSLNLFGLLCEQEGLLAEAIATFERVLGSDKMADRSDLKACVQYNLARVLVERGDLNSCKKAIEIYSNQINSGDHVTQAYKALAYHLSGEHDKADNEYAVLMESGPQVDLSHFLTARAVTSLESNPGFSKDLLFKAFQTQPTSVFSVIGLISFGVIVNDLTLTMAAVEELIKLEEWSQAALHPTCIDSLVYIKVCLLNNSEGAGCLQRINDLWLLLKGNRFYCDILEKKENLVSVWEHQKSGNLDQARISAAKYYHNFPSDIELIPFILDTLQL